MGAIRPTSVAMRRRACACDWRAWHLEPRWSLALGERARLEFGRSAAHLTRDRDWPLLSTDLDGSAQLIRVGRRRDSGLGGMASLAVAFDLGARQQLRIDYHRLHAGLGERCEQHAGGYMDCGLPSYTSVDGLGVAWSHRFD